MRLGYNPETKRGLGVCCQRHQQGDGYKHYKQSDTQATDW